MDEIDDIMDNFDFDRVHDTMEMLGWGWVDRDTGDYAIPEIIELRKRARSLMKEAMNSSQSSYGISTGGFQVDKKTIEGKTYLSLSFVLTSWDNYA